MLFETRFLGLLAFQKALPRRREGRPERVAGQSELLWGLALGVWNPARGIDSGMQAEPSAFFFELQRTGAGRDKASAERARVMMQVVDSRCKRSWLRTGPTRSRSGCRKLEKKSGSFFMQLRPTSHQLDAVQLGTRPDSFS